MTKLRVGVVFGGRSAEHEVSLVSAASVINALDKNKYEVVPIGITHEGRWLSSTNAVQLLKEHRSIEQLPEHLLVPDPRKQALVELGSTARNSSTPEGTSQPLDAIFPLIHGTYGEDGTIQGLFELADIPYVGAGVLGSAVGMDKVIQKELLRQAKIPTAPSVWFLFSDFARESKKFVLQCESKLRYPMFVKPSNSGSSIGISKAHNRKELVASITLAGQYDRKVLVEQGVKNAREIEVSVLGNDTAEASVPGEIIPSNEFYDYDAKYVDGKSASVIPAKLPKPVVKKLQAMAVDAFRALDCFGMARVDFLVEKKTNRMFLNEINTVPGFTSISMYPKLWEASGLSYPQLLDKLIELALKRHAEKKTLKTTYQPKEDWYKQ
ncbi:MAG: D-alanine--D-alanine ligase [Ignavibacteriales bacterium]|nr:D-alanine--D-alanine ligase [Ignavibacteriales bacterium]